MCRLHTGTSPSLSPAAPSLPTPASDFTNLPTTSSPSHIISFINFSSTFFSVSFPHSPAPSATRLRPSHSVCYLSFLSISSFSSSRLFSLFSRLFTGLRNLPTVTYCYMFNINIQTLNVFLFFFLIKNLTARVFFKHYLCFGYNEAKTCRPNKRRCWSGLRASTRCQLEAMMPDPIPDLSQCQEISPKS